MKLRAWTKRSPRATPRRPTLSRLGLAEVLSVLALLLLSSLAAVAATGSIGAFALTLPSAQHGTLSSGPSATASASPTPAASGWSQAQVVSPAISSSGRGTFFNNTEVPNPVAGTNYCPYYYFCWNNTDEPSANVTTAGYTGVAYTAYTNSAPCPAMDGNTTVPDAVSEIGFVASPDFGGSWSSPLYLGNPVCTGDGANYASAFQPALTSLANGTFAVAYIEYNYSKLSTYAYAAPSNQYNTYCSGYYHIAHARVVVSLSYNDGASWSVPTVVNETNLTSCPTTGFPDLRPSIAVHGSTLYVAWETLSRPLLACCSTTSIGSVFIASSTNGGLTWTAPSQLATVNGYDGDYNDNTQVALNPNIVVDPNGKLYVAYVTGFNDTYTGPPCYCYVYTSSVRVATSTNNGSTFSYATATSSAGWVGTDYPTYFVDPAPSIAYNTVSGDVYLVYSALLPGSYCRDEGVFGYYCGSYLTAETVWYQNSSTGGSSWSAPENLVPTGMLDPNGGWASMAFNPSVAVDYTGTIHVQYTFMNNSYCTPGTDRCDGWEQYYTNSTDGGATWSSPADVFAYESTPSYEPTRYYFDSQWPGTYSTIVTAGSQVMLAWVTEQCPSYFTCYNGYPYGGAEVVTSVLYQGPGVSLTFSETGLAPATPWSLEVQGNLFASVAGTNIVVSGVPPSGVVAFAIEPVQGGYGVSYTPATSVGSPSGFATSTTVSVTFSETVLVNILAQPTIEYYWWIDGEVNYQMNPVPGSQWVTVGTSLTGSVLPYNAYAGFCYYCLNLTFQAWTGTGNGSVSATTQNITFTVNGPVNETANFGIVGWCINPRYASGQCLNYTDPLTFQAVGLPTGTEWGITVQDPSTGLPVEYETSATSLTVNATSQPLAYTMWTVPTGVSGYSWIPSSSASDPVYALTSPLVTITYSYGAVSSSLFGTTFVESGLPNGTAWSLEVGSSSYGVSSSNLSLRLTGATSYAVNGSFVYLTGGTGYYVSAIRYTPYVVNASSSSSGTPGSYTPAGPGIVTLVYSPMYYVTVTASVGGSVTPGSQWVMRGHSIQLNESAAATYHFVGWTGTGGGSVSTGTSNPTLSPTAPVTELATFRPNAPPTWNLTVAAMGLAPGVGASISVNGQTFTGVAPLRIGNLTTGNYTVSAAIVFLNATGSVRFVPMSVTSTLPLTGGVLEVTSDGYVNLTYQAQDLVSLVATPNGAITMPTGGAGSYWYNDSEAATFTATPASGFILSSWNGSGPGSMNSTSASITVTPTGPITETAQFLPQPIRAPATFVLTVTESGLPSTVAWSVVVGSGGASGTGTSLLVTGLNGSYLLTAPTIYSAVGTRWVSDTTNVSQTVTSNASYTVTYSEQFLVSVGAGSGGNASASAWANASSSVTLVATPDSGQEFLSWNGSGGGWTNSTSASVTFTVTGPVTVQASFAPIPPPPAKQSSSSTSVANGQLLSFGLLIGLLVVGLVIGMLLARRRGRQPPMQEYGGSEGSEEAPVEAPAESEVYSEGPPSS